MRAAHSSCAHPLTHRIPLPKDVLGDILKHACGLAQQRDCKLQTVVFGSPAGVRDAPFGFVRAEGGDDGAGEVGEGEGVGEEGECELGGEGGEGEARRGVEEG